ncbi:MAG: hypothetical protein KC609_26410 [Myxococcales bacterium]|nr:hypothetical protein [Myxococcales bacterium]
MRRHRNRFAVIVLLSGLTLGAHAANRYAAGKRGLETVARAFLDKGADLRRLTLALKPKPGDYDAIFRDKESAAKARAYGERVWRQVGRQPIDPRAKYDHVLVFEATPEDLKAGRGDAPHFACGIRRIA